jgi:hypothetical protein
MIHRYRSGGRDRSIRSGRRRDRVGNNIGQEGSRDALIRLHIGKGVRGDRSHRTSIHQHIGNMIACCRRNREGLAGAFLRQKDTPGRDCSIWPGLGRNGVTDQLFGEVALVPGCVISRGSKIIGSAIGQIWKSESIRCLIADIHRVAIGSAGLAVIDFIAGQSGLGIRIPGQCNLGGISKRWAEERCAKPQDKKGRTRENQTTSIELYSSEITFHNNTSFLSRTRSSSRGGVVLPAALLPYPPIWRLRPAALRPTLSSGLPFSAC